MRGDFSVSVYDPYSINRGEYIEWKLLSDSNGDLTLNTDGYGVNGLAAGYNWLVYVNGEYMDNFIGYSTPNLNASGGLTPDLVSYITIATGLTPNTEYTVRIIPKRIVYGWARALSSPFDALTEIVYDKSYMGYGKNATDTGDYFRYGQYYECGNLLNGVDEVLPDTVTTIGNNFRAYQYGFKSWAYKYGRLTSAVDEVMPNSVTSIGNGFRSEQYRHSNISIGSEEVFSSNVVTVGDNFRYYQYSFSKILIAPDEEFSNSVTSIGGNFRFGQYNYCLSLTQTGIEKLSTNLVSASSMRFYQYYDCPSLRIVSGIEAYPYSFGYKANQFNNSTGSSDFPMVVYINGSVVDSVNSYMRYYDSLGLDNNNVYRIIVDNNLISPYRNASRRSGIEDWKFGDVLDNYMLVAESGDSFVTEDGDDLFEMELSNKYLNTTKFYPIHFVNYDLAYISTVMVEALDTPVYNGENPIKPSSKTEVYTFEGWNTFLIPATIEATYIAIYSTSTRYYTVTFEDYDGTVLQQTQQTYHSTVTPPQDPTRQGYFFEEWSPAIDIVETDITYTAIYKSMAGIYHKDRTITLSSDGINWITIDDRDLGAAWAWNEGDQYTVYNTGWTFQWGNNYEFDKVVSGGVSKIDQTQIRPSVGYNLEGFGYGTESTYTGDFYYDYIYRVLSGAPYRWNNVINDNLWGGITNTLEARQGSCEDGFHIPTSAEFNSLISLLDSIGVSNSSIADYLKMPRAGYFYYDSQSANQVGSEGFYWTSDVGDYRSNGVVAYPYLIINVSSEFHINLTEPSNGQSIRAFKNEFVAPDLSDSNWQILYDDGNGGGIYRYNNYINSNEGIISITADGQTGITIMDRNNGAEDVRNPGDTLGFNNCGYRYQRGNCNGFERCNISRVSSGSNQYSVLYYGIRGGGYYSYDVYCPIPNWIQLRGGASGDDYRGGVTDTNVSKKGPCYDGTHIPSKNEMSDLCSAVSALGLNLNDTIRYLKIARPGYRNYSDPNDIVGTNSNIIRWTATTQYTTAFHGYLSSSGLSLTNDTMVGYGGNIRPFKNTQEIPDSTWTVLYQPN